MPQVLKLTKIVSDGFENKSCIKGKFLNLTNTLDCTSPIIITKINFSGGSLLPEVHKQQYVAYKKLGLTLVKYGALQGSISEPILFLIYINDFSNSNDGSIMLFTDDTTRIYLDKNYS